MRITALSPAIDGCWYRSYEISGNSAREAGAARFHGFKDGVDGHPEWDATLVHVVERPREEGSPAGEYWTRLCAEAKAPDARSIVVLRLRDSDACRSYALRADA